jgi:hypothetical protein
MRSILASQSHEIADKQNKQYEHASNVDPKYDVMQAIKLVGVLSHSAQQEKCDKDKADASRG